MDNVSNYKFVYEPPHYAEANKIECVDYIKERLGTNTKYFFWGNVIKYIHRWEKKGGLEDLKKASVYLDWMIQEEQEG